MNKQLLRHQIQETIFSTSDHYHGYIPHSSSKIIWDNVGSLDLPWRASVDLMLQNTYFTLRDEISRIE